MGSLAPLDAHLRTLGRVLLGYSGGVDSSLLALAGRNALGRDGLLAVIGRSPSYPEVQYQAALATARRFDIPLLEVDTHELEDDRYRANPANRCYFCKSELWRVLGQVAADRGAETIIDGTNADDLGDHRPGLRAAGEHQIRSPLAELGWT
ncbi:MAG: TIGR00268 family protein, partial [Gemmatimonadota bacterium]|nr:TIGR00268 family protein [Gemmatimonadota bacterium]